MYVRFVDRRIDPSLGRRPGLIQAAFRLKDAGVLARHDDQHIGEIYLWFNRNLKVPTRFSVSSRPHRKAQALSWFRDSAKAHIAKMREFQDIFERYGLSVQMIKSKRPGYILYQDEHQVSAYPFSDTPS